MLARREYSQGELSRQLQQKGFQPMDIDTTLAGFIQEGLLSDTRFTENFIHSRRAKGYGPVRIRMDLLERGINKDLIEDHLLITDNAWLDTIQSVWQKRFKNRYPDDFKTRAKQMRFLQSRGFTREQIDSIFRREN